jgi:DNA helicase II / ATP-dependent DNA helicase PcrA
MAREATAVPGLKDRAARALRDFGLLMDEVVSLRDHPAEEVIRKLLTLSGYREALQAEGAPGEDRLANIDELISAAREFEREHPHSTIIDFLEEISLASAVDRWKDDGGSVTLMTLHAAKGLEFPVAFIVGLEQGILPHSRANESDDELEEERRLLFVGITRAERELYLSHCRIREFRGQRQATIPSLFLRELPEEALVLRDLTGGQTPTSSPPPWKARMEWPKPSARPNEFRLMTAADLAGAGPKLASTPSDDALGAFQPGVSVMHPQYGLGRIVAIDGAGPNRKGKVAFTLGGERTFILAKSPLKPVKGR